MFQPQKSLRKERSKSTTLKGLRLTTYDEIAPIRARIFYDLDCGRSAPAWRGEAESEDWSSIGIKTLRAIEVRRPWPLRAPESYRCHARVQCFFTNLWLLANP